MHSLVAYLSIYISNKYPVTSKYINGAQYNSSTENSVLLSQKTYYILNIL